ncbi:MAG: hypothetical protein M1837_006541, partial [Sclerophora amabilis]
MAPLPTRRLGKNGPDISALGFGLMGMSVGYGTTENDADCLKILDRAHELGETFWDTADVYGDSEDLVGKWLKRTGKRNDIFLATKFANIMNWDTMQMEINSTPEYVKKACDKSLQRLGVDQIDLYYCHRVDRKTPIEKTVAAMAELQKEGKVKYLGLSEVSSETLRRACAVQHIDAVQMEYSPFAMEIESPASGLLKPCRELGVATVAYSPIGRGFLTGAYKPPADFEEEKLNVLATKKNCTAGQLTLAWLMGQGEDIFPTPGTKKVKYLEANVGTLQVNLTRAEDAEIRQVVGETEVWGDRAAP